MRILYFIFCIHLIYNIERLTLINEIFSFIGIILLFANLKNFNFKFNEKYIYYLFLYISWNIIILISSVNFLNKTTSFQVYLRTLPIFYSIFSYILGFYFYSLLTKNLMFFSLGSYSSIFTSNVLLPPLSFLYFNFRKKLSIVLILLLLAITWKNYLMNYGSSTLYLCFLFIFSVYFFPRITYKFLSILKYKFFITVLLLFLYFSIYIFASQFDLSVIDFTEESFFDANNLWRLLFWGKIITSLWDQNTLLMGFGYGAPIFDPLDASSRFISDARPDDDILEYTIGMHHSLLTILHKSGIVGLFLFICFVSSFFNRFLSIFGLNSLNDRLFLVFCLILLESLFNVILESPLYASIFWIIFGMLHKKILIAKVSTNHKYFS